MSTAEGGRVVSRDARVPRLTVEEAKTKAAEAGVPDYMADLNIFQILLRHPRLARGVNDLLATLLWHGELDTRLRELVIMRIGWLTGSEYEWTQHWRVARSLGVTDDDLLAVRDWRSQDRFGPAERAVLAATDDIVLTGTMTPATWDACAQHVGTDVVLVELVAVIGTWRMVAAVLLSLEVPLEDGVASWPPDGVRPPGATVPHGDPGCAT